MEYQDSTLENIHLFSCNCHQYIFSPSPAVRLRYLRLIMRQRERALFSSSNGTLIVPLLDLNFAVIIAVNAVCV